VANQEVIWNKIAPLKVSLFAWRLLKNKLPSKDNLLHRGMNQLDSVLCVGDCGVVETSDHLFFGCKLATPLWCNIMLWLGISCPVSNSANEHAMQFCNTYLFRKEVRQGIRVIWLACCWTIWKERNNRVFSNQGVSADVLLDKVKTLAWWWLKTRQNNFNYALNCWWVHPLACLGICHG
jgi:hypothetical protein